MLITKRNYQKTLEKLIREEKILSDKMIQLFTDCGISQINMGSVGNSIASGYTKCDEMLPLFERTSLIDCSYNINFFSYARVRRNEEFNVLNWYHQNISHQEINLLLIADIMAKRKKYANFGDVQSKKYEAMKKRTNIGMRDYVKLENNIMIYNGLSGTLTDIVRKGDACDRVTLLRCFKNDCEYLKMFLTELYLDNPCMQIYICGLPDILGLGISNIFDEYIKKAVKSVPNAVYIKGAARNMLSILDGQIELDYHYSRPEYLHLMCSVWKSILENYIPMCFKCEMLRNLKKYSKVVELTDTTSKGEKEIINSIVVECIKKYENLCTQYGVDVVKIKKEIWNYYNKNYLVSYGCTNRRVVRDLLLNKV